MLVPSSSIDVKPAVSSSEAPRPPTNSNPPKSNPPKSSDLPSRSTVGPVPIVPAPAPGPTSGKPEVKSDRPTTAQSTPTSIPELSLVTIEVVRSTAGATPVGTDVFTTSSASRIPLARWNGNGALLNGYCATPEYTIIDGPTAYWAPVVGCVRSKADCCPFDLAAATATIAARQEAPVTATIAASSGNGGFPNAISPAQATLSKCPSDYHSIGDGCCPLNYFQWSTTFGGQTPCYSTVIGAVTPPPIGANVPSNPSQPTSAIVNIVYAMQYPLQVTEPVPTPSLATGAKIGIGAGAGVVALIFGLLAFLLLKKHKAHKRDKAALEEMSGIGSTRQSVATGSAFGGVKAWQTKVASSEVSSGLEPVLEPTLPQVVMPQQTQYPAEWRPGQRSISAPVQVPHPGYHARNSAPSPPIPEGYSEVGSDGGRRSELYSGEFGMQRHELQNGYQAYGGHEDWQQQGAAQPTRYYEVPDGRATPRVG
ncbi:hypothetical protein GQ44DRAFT_179935 [Phaeosphaeriaceae sp. PMI808]|nr:hypothetical protein GQ44DRAFT_179935 [Phaeosphaeriaceae sp. PMI808]